MLNKIIQYSLNSRLTVLILTVIALIGGMMALLRTEVDIFPDLNAPTVVVMTEAPGMAAEEVEKNVTYPVETAMNGSTGVRRVRSQSTTGFSVVWVEFDWGTDVYIDRQIVAERLSTIETSLPPTVGSPVLGPQSSILGEMMIIGLSSDTVSLMDLRSIADRTISPAIMSLSGVSQVSVIGGDVMQYRIQLHPEQMRHLGVSLQDVLEACEGLNDNVGGGVLYQYDNEYIIKSDINTASTEEIGACPVATTDDGGYITLADVATITTAAEQPRLGAASIKTRPSVLITVTKQPATGTIALTEDIEQLLDNLKPSLPAGVEIATDIFRQSDFIDASISNLQKSLMEGALFVIIVLFVFLMNVRTTIISLVALPVSVIIAVLVLNMLGLTINTMSLGGIAIAIGSLVDDAIVDVENVYKRIRENRQLPKPERRPILSVVYHASAEVRTPIFNSSLIIIASFLPLFFLSGIEGRMLIPLGISFIIALIASTIVALTLTPVLCSLLLGKGADAERIEKLPKISVWLREWYARLLSWTLSHFRVIGITTAVLVVAALALFFTLGRSFLPQFNEGSFTINVSTLPGVSLQESDRVGRMAEEIILSVPEIRTVARKTGRAELDEHSLGVNVSEIEAPYTLQGRTRNEIAHELRTKLQELPGVNVEIGQPISHRIDAMLSGTEAQIAIKVFGDNLNTIFSTGRKITEAIEGVPGIVDVNIEQQMERPQLHITPKRTAMARYGITMPEFREVVEVGLRGRTVSQVMTEGMPYDVVVILDSISRGTIDAIGRIAIDTRSGKVPLEEVAEIKSTTGPNTISREDVKRRIVVSANVSGRDLRGAVNDIQKAIAAKVQLPEGVTLSYGGQFESEESASRTLMWATLGALVIIFMLLYHQFKSVKESVIILVNMPLAMVGGVFALLLTGGELNIPAIIGFISLLGITTRNGMLLLSRFDQLRAEGHSAVESVRIGSVDRLLPIIMTALTSALALIPLAVNGSESGNEIQSPMAIVIIGGLITSTILNLLIVPKLYLKICTNER